MKDPDRYVEWVQAQQWLSYAIKDLEKAKNYGVSEEDLDQKYAQNHLKAALRSVEEACAFLGIEVTIPALENDL